MLIAFQDQLQENFHELRDAKILIAISGGVDSVVLTHLCAKSGLNISLAHCNFHLRAEESDADETFVLELADALELEIFIEHFDTETYSEENKISIQMAARILRYQWFEELRNSLGFDFVLTAHHANDDLETFLINFVRGTGMDGLTGIQEKNESVRRPLLPFSRKSIEEFARKNQLFWREDSSNDSTKYLRNKIRKEIVPKLEEMNPQLLESFGKTQSHLKQSAALVEDYISALFPRLAEQNKYGYGFNIKLLKTVPHTKAVLYELFKTFGFTEWDDIFHLLDAQPGKMVISNTHRLIKDREELLLTGIPSGEDTVYRISEAEEVVMLPIGTFQLEQVENLSEVGHREIFVDADKLSFPLYVRKWRTGDYFHPFGMQGKKKVSKFFKDNKLSLPEKENSWLLCSKNDIIWIVGYRADSRFAVGKSSKAILKITYTS